MYKQTVSITSYLEKESLNIGHSDICAHHVFGVVYVSQYVCRNAKWLTAAMSIYGLICGKTSLVFQRLQEYYTYFSDIRH